MRQLLLKFLSVWLLCTGVCAAQEFDRLHASSIQPALSQPLLWVSAPAAAAPTLPQAFAANTTNWRFKPYADSTVLPTSVGTDAWASFTLAAAEAPTSWMLRVPRTTLQKVSLYRALPDGSQVVQSAGMSIAPADWSLRTREPTFALQSGPTPQTYFLRFEHHSPISERPTLMSPIDFADDASRVGLLIGLMFGMFGILVVLCIAANRLASNTAFLSLGAFVAPILLTNLVLMGYGGWQMWPDSLYLNRAMQWTAPLLALAAACWFCVKASYAKATSTAVYRLLGFAAIGSLLMAGVTLATEGSGLPRDVFNGWVALVLLVVIGSLVWLCAKGQRWNGWLLSGFMPLAAAASSRLAYNYGLIAQVEVAQNASLFLTQLGLMWLFMALAWRSRAALLTNERKAALKTYNSATGLTAASVVKVDLPRLLLRGSRLKLGCGVLMLRPVDYDKNIRALGTAQRAEVLAVFGRLLQRVARDIDTAAHLDDSNFLMLIEGPIKRSALASLATQIISSCLRASQKAGKPNLFNLHIAVWQGADAQAGSAEVLALLSTRLNQMAAGTQGAVQFVDTPLSAPSSSSAEESTLRRLDVIEKINAIEASHRLPPVGVAKRRKATLPPPPLI